MNFASLPFLAFLVALLPCAALLRRSIPARNALLLCASYGFYAAWDPRFLGLLAGSTLVDFFAARRLEDPSARRRAWLLLSVVVNLGILATFKYLGFFTQGLQDLGALVGWDPGVPTLRVLLPVGISFYTFQSLGYTIDVYRGRVPAERNLLTFALFVAWFPQLVAGPIERARDLLPQLRAPTPATWARIQRGFFLLVSGLFKKVVLADNVAVVVDRVFAAAEPARIDVLIAAYAFAIQIYCDFSGYTDIARGVSKWLGIDLSRNFDRPYLAPTPRAFWQRWHITLGTWFRDYVYLPLGGRTHVVRNVLLTFLLAGLWHGAAWTFVLWGLFHGLWLLLWRALPGRRAWPRLLSVLGTFHGVCFGWLLFRADTLSDLGRLLSASGTGVLDRQAWQTVGCCAGLLLIAAAVRGRRQSRDWVFDLPLPARVVSYLVLWFGLLLFGVRDDLPFLYFQF